MPPSIFISKYFSKHAAINNQLITTSTSAQVIEKKIPNFLVGTLKAICDNEHFLHELLQVKHIIKWSLIPT